MTFDKINAARLTQLADHLDSEKPLGVGWFDFGVYHCDTAGCAIGECVHLWPDHWTLANPETHEVPVLRGTKKSMTDTSTPAMKWFGLSQEEEVHLFIPEAQRPHKYGGNHLDGKATRHEVAHNIREFLKVKAIEHR